MQCVLVKIASGATGNESGSDNVACATGVTEGERGGGISGRARRLLQLVYFSFYLFCNV